MHGYRVKIQQYRIGRLEFKLKKIGVLVLSISLLLTGCSKQSDVLMLYSGTDGKLNESIGTYVDAVAADFLTKDYGVVEESQNHMEDPAIPAIAAFLIDDTDHQVLFAKNVYDRIYPASTTKLLTALIVFKYGNLNDSVTIEKDNAGVTTYGAKLCNFKAGDVVSMETLLNCLLVYSGNDAAVAIAEHMYGSEEEFVKRMNEEAAKIGATNTHFTNPHGLHDPNHYTTAYDMYLIFKECLKYEKFVPIIKQINYEASITDKDGKLRRKSYETTNMFLLGTKETPEGVTVFGGKTGSTGDAGDCLILYSNSADGKAYISAVFKAAGKTSLYNQHAYLLEME